MRKTLALLLILLLLLGALPTFAVPPADLNALGRYFPADAPVLVSVRTDDGFIETLDSLITRINAVVPEGEDEIPSLDTILDMAVGQIGTDATFADTIRPWLGDTASIGFTSLDNLLDDGSSNDTDNLAFAVSITDRALATDFFVNLIEENGGTFDQTEEDGYTLLLNPDADGALYILDDAVIFAQTTDVLDLESAMSDNLSASEDFTSALALLPASDYNATVYINQQALMGAMTAGDPAVAASMQGFSGFFENLGAQVWGFTLLDDTSLVMDIVQEVGDMSELGFATVTTGPIDPEFARFIPADALASIQGVDLNASATGGLDNLQTMLEAQAEMLEQSGTSAEEVGAMVEQVEQGFTALTGLDLRDEFLSWMTGDYALFVSLNPELMGTVTGSVAESPFELGFIVEVTDPAAAQQTVEGLSRSFNQLAALAGLDEENSNGGSAEVMTEEIGGAEVTVLSIVTPDVPFVIEILLGANEEVFALGTRQAVTLALTGDGGLNTNVAFTAAQAYTLPDAMSVGWLSIEGLQPALDMAAAFGSAEDAEAIESIASLIVGGTISSVVTEDGVTISRAVLTLSE